MILTVAVAALSLISLFMGVFVATRNYSDRIKRAFANFAFLNSIWMMTNYIGSNFKDYSFSKYFIYTDFFLGPLLTYAFWRLTSQFLIEAQPERSRFQRRFGWAFLLLVIAGAISTLSPLLGTVESLDGQIKIEYGSYYPIYSAVTALGVALAFYNLIDALRNSSGRLKAQVKTMLVGLVILAISVSTANLVIPELTDSESVNLAAGNLAYMGIFAFELATFYAIVKHRLFDLRLALTRSVGFLLTIGVVALVYSFLVLGIGSRFLFRDTNDSVTNAEIFLLLIIPTIFVALTFHRIQGFIARITKRIFYQDAYDPQTALDSLSDTLITDNDMDKIMNNSLKVVSEAIRPTHAVFVVLGEFGRIYRQVSLGSLGTGDATKLVKQEGHSKHQVIVKDERPAGHWPAELEAQDISLVLRLGESAKPSGLLFFWPQQNGRIYTKQDIDLLTIGAKNLALALENAKKYEQISRFADTLKVEIQKATADLRAANKRLKTLDVLKDDFISMASHQLRTPASSVHEAIQMLNSASLSNAERKKLTELAEASSEHLVSVVVDMLSIARIQAGHFNIDKTLNSMTELVKRTLKELSVLVEEKHIKISFKPPKEKTETLVDRAKINEAITNYIENAIKYSPEKTEVQVSLQVKGKRIHFEVIDSGIGVPQAERKNLFTKFYRAKNARTEHPDGNGIGLFVVKTIAESHDGEAYYAPQASGSLFGFWIPIVKK